MVESIDINPINFKASYLRAKSSYLKCVRDTENVFLNDEFKVDLETDIFTKEDSIKIVLSGYNSSEYTLEIKLLLLNKENEELGFYTLVTESEGIVVDDFLVFY